jgi:hypothetical protein
MKAVRHFKSFKIQYKFKKYLKKMGGTSDDRNRIHMKK